ncbi:hypothetical protein RJ639_044712 [Escallonia herrerae]|uniref:Uncharacterized protein n=1 Tax=Escallonia herrerae TaxID=1293975 RepID=A0AA88WC27_9ASTE|nr:hypothetical protein RJ639_044712 [Escallonia herrerae]
MERGKLVRLWIAEGFIEHDKAKKPPLLAEEYFAELVHRSMLQAVTRSHTGRPKTCQMHDLVRELAISTSEAEKFSIVYNGEGSGEEVRTAPRLSIQTTSKVIKSITGLAKVRSLFMFSANLIPPSSAITLPTGLRLIRVLDLESVPIETLSDEVGDLFNLSYLNLKGTKLKELPKSIGRLRSLQTLDIRDTKIEVVPDGIGKLQKLQNLLAYRDNPNVDDFCFISGIKFPSSICKLKSLNVFDCVTAEPNLLKQLRNITQLISFGITNVREEDGRDLCISLQSMCLLRYLFVMVTDEEEYIEINSPAFAPTGLKNLVLVGKLETVPHWFGSLQHLTSLYLHWSKLIEDLLPHIQALANLGELVVINAYAGSKLCFLTGFNKLVHLYFRSLSQLDEIIIEKGVMPGLQRIYVGNCTELKMLPRGIEYLTSLEKLDLVSPVSTELLESIREEGSVDRQRVRHIPEINHFFESASGISHESLSRLDFKKGRCSLILGYIQSWSYRIIEFRSPITLIPHLNRVIVEKGVPSLQRLWLGNCPKLKMLPRGIEHLNNLKQLDLDRVQTELIDSIRSVESVDPHKVQGIPEINHYHQSESGMSYETLSGLDSRTIKDQISSYRDDA